jgi:hypothetical protein
VKFKLICRTSKGVFAERIQKERRIFFGGLELSWGVFEAYVTQKMMRKVVVLVEAKRQRPFVK